MTEPLPIRRTIAPHDINAARNVVVWDHGPSDEMPEPAPWPSDSDAFKAEAARRKAARVEWERVNGDVAVPIVMQQQDAAQALGADARYALEPMAGLGDEVDAEIKNVQDQRAEADKVAKERADAAQLVIDRKAAIATVMSN